MVEVTRRDRLEETARWLREQARLAWLIAVAAGGGAATLRLGPDHPWRDWLMWGAIVLTALMIGAGAWFAWLGLRAAREMDHLHDEGPR